MICRCLAPERPMGSHNLIPCVLDVFGVCTIAAPIKRRRAKASPSAAMLPGNGLLLLSFRRFVDRLLRAIKPLLKSEALKSEAFWFLKSRLSRTRKGGSPGKSSCRYSCQREYSGCPRARSSAEPKGPNPRSVRSHPEARPSNNLNYGFSKLTSRRPVYRFFLQ